MRWAFVFCLGLLLWFCVSSSAWAFDKQCKALFKQKKFLEAATCFEGLLPAVSKKKAELGSIVPLLMDRFLRHSAVGYQRAADQSRNDDEKSYLKELAISRLEQSFKDGYCEAARRCRTNRLFINELKAEIHYGSLVIITGNAQAQIKVKGYKYAGTGKNGTFNEKLRPGNFQVVILFPGKKETSQTVTLKPETTQTLNATPEKIIMKEKRIYIAKKIPPVVYISYVAGGLVFAGGVVLGVYGWTLLDHTNRCNSDIAYRKQSCLNAEGQWPESQHEREKKNAFTWIGLGVGLAVVGVATVVGGVVLHSIANKNKQKDKKVIRKLSLTPPPTTPTFLLSSFD